MFPKCTVSRDYYEIDQLLEKMQNKQKNQN